MLLLTSSGLTTPALASACIAALSKPAAEIRALMITNAAAGAAAVYVAQSKKELEDLGIPGAHITVAVLSDPKTHAAAQKAAPEFDLVYVCGGNTFAILDALRKTGLDARVRDAVRSGALYIGVSAGSILAGPDIAIAGWGSEGDRNDIGLQGAEELAGFGFVDLTVAPHFRDELQGEVDAFRKTVKYPVYELKDGEGLLVNENKATKIG